MLDHFDAATKHNRIIIKSKCKASGDCAICLDRLTGKTCAYLPCTHLFHNSCLDEAFKQKLYTCPLCRYDLVEALKKTDFIFPIVEHSSSDFSFIDGIHRIYLTASYNNTPLDYDNLFTYAYVNSNRHITSTHDDDNELMPDLVVESDSDVEMEENNTSMAQQDRWNNILTHIMQDTLFGLPPPEINSNTVVYETATDVNDPEMSFYDFLGFFNI